MVLVLTDSTALIKSFVTHGVKLFDLIKEKPFNTLKCLHRFHTGVLMEEGKKSISKRTCLPS